MSVIRVVEVGNVPQKYLDYLTDELNKMSSRYKFVVDSQMDLPDDAYDSYRDQYDAQQILDRARDSDVLFVTNGDLYTGKKNFVFGLTKNQGPSIVSIARLDPSFYGNQMNFASTSDRLVKESLHEVGHMMGMNHCDNTQCVMSFSQHFTDVDAKQRDFCNDCQLEMSTEGIEF